MILSLNFFSFFYLDINLSFTIKGIENNDIGLVLNNAFLGSLDVHSLDVLGVNQTAGEKTGVSKIKVRQASFV